MARLTVEGSELVLCLSALEKVAAFHGDVRVLLRSVRFVDVERHPWTALRGLRAPGTGIPGLVSFGIRRFGGGRDFAAVVAGRAAVKVDLDDSSPFARLVVSVRDADATAAAIRTAAGLRA